MWSGSVRTPHRATRRPGSKRDIVEKEFPFYFRSGGYLGTRMGG